MSSPGLNSLWWCFIADGSYKTWIATHTFQRMVRRNLLSILLAPDFSTAPTYRSCCRLNGCLKPESRPFSIVNPKLIMIAFCPWRRWVLQRISRTCSHNDRLQNTNRWWKRCRNLATKWSVTRELDRTNLTLILWQRKRKSQIFCVLQVLHVIHNSQQIRKQSWNRGEEKNKVLQLQLLQARQPS